MSYRYNIFLSFVVAHRLAALYWVFTTVVMVGQYICLSAWRAFVCAFLCQLSYSFSHLKHNNFSVRQFLFLMSLWLCVSVSLMSRNSLINELIQKSSPTKTNQSHVDFHFFLIRCHIFLFFFEWSYSHEQLKITIRMVERKFNDWRRKWNFLLWKHKKLNFRQTQNDENFIHVLFNEHFN